MSMWQWGSEQDGFKIQGDVCSISQLRVVLSLLTRDTIILTVQEVEQAPCSASQ